MDVSEKDFQNTVLAVGSGWNDRFHESIDEAKNALAKPPEDATKKEALQMRIRLLQALQQASRIAHFLSLGCEDGGPLQDTNNKAIVQVAPLDFQIGESLIDHFSPQSLSLSVSLLTRHRSEHWRGVQSPASSAAPH